MGGSKYELNFFLQIFNENYFRIRALKYIFFKWNETSSKTQLKK